MRLLVVNTVSLLVLMFMSDSAAGHIAHKCMNTYPAVPCTKDDYEDWFQMGEGRCVKAFGTERLNFDDAEKSCVDHGGHLVSIHNTTELNQVVCTMYRVTPRRPPYWIGLKLTLHYEDYLVYDWTDETQHTFSRFAYMQPDFYNEEEECVEINYYYWGHWNDVSCDILRGYVCAVDL
ncbi:C-type lectin galactose-binding isoform-like isoform X1 [Larimichthys crocea]|uniref:C-type lectin galactose-binding isoform-like isoform X1 n=2 Tax=Larimichthys crocea TaxID=215358 RepID=UPI000900C715|nr:C-type lectin galactose-binding isoform-like isoform X1 [Larimichthys crocea]TMS01261.1 Neurocan core protein [Larimichthys crocea]